VREILKHMPARSFRPGDMVATNNPWWIMGHLNDIAVVAPLFHRGRLVAFAECMAHMADIGGLLSGAPREVYEEGLIIPPLKIFERGRENATFFSMLAANVRVPRHTPMMKNTSAREHATPARARTDSAICWTTVPCADGSARTSNKR